jgi:hypothetical protein
MIICPWCGTGYLTFQPNCTNCGGLLPAAELSDSTDNLTPPPSLPRTISDSYVWRLVSTDSRSIAALVFGLVGIIFSLVGVALTLAIITAFLGIPFLLLGIIFLGIGVWIFILRYQEMQQVVNVLRVGEATRGEIVECRENYSVRINGRNPWVIRYQFRANGQDYEGMVTTLNQPGQPLLAGKAVYVLYLPSAPKYNSIYPHP